MVIECEECKLPVDDANEKLCKICSKADMDKAEESLSQTKQVTACPCEEGSMNKQSMIQCTCCVWWWHLACVGLDGLSKYSCNSIVEWKCPICFTFSPELREKFPELKEKFGDDVQNDVSDIRSEVKKEVAASIPEIIKQVEKSFISAFSNFQSLKR